MSTRRLFAVCLAVFAALAAVLGTVYVAVACESLPSFLGSVPGDSHPRTRLGAGLIVAAVALATTAAGLTRSRPRR